MRALPDLFLASGVIIRNIFGKLIIRCGANVYHLMKEFQKLTDHTDHDVPCPSKAGPGGYRGNFEAKGLYFIRGAGLLARSFSQFRELAKRLGAQLRSSACSGRP